MSALVEKLIEHRRAVREGRMTVAEQIAAREELRELTRQSLDAANERLAAAGRPRIVTVGGDAA